jgi:hypothetical protein
MEWRDRRGMKLPMYEAGGMFDADQKRPPLGLHGADELIAEWTRIVCARRDLKAYDRIA